MATQHPIVRIARDQAAKKRIPGRKPRFPRAIGYEKQGQRLSKTFDTAAKSLAEWEKGAKISADPRAVVPERALVFDLLGPVADFQLAAQALGLEWLTGQRKSEDGDEETADDDEELQSQTIYVTMPSLAGLQKLLAMWNRYQKGQKPEKPEAPFWKIFEWLYDLRVWSIKDRVDPALTNFINKLLKEQPDRVVQVELDFWYRNAKERRDSAITTLQTMLDEVGGTLIDLVEIEEIRYQGALVAIPAKVASELAERNGKLGGLDEIMTIRPQSQYADDAPEDENAEAEAGYDFGDNPPTGECITAVLDGYPIENHEALAGRVIIEEVDVTGAQVPALNREHGTAMASMILHGDLGALPPASINRKIASFPILTMSKNAEVIASNKLAIGIVHRALQRIVAHAESDSPLRNITVINHSICDTNAPFVRRPSPWAMLLDFYSHHHRLLFVISGGNIYSKFPVTNYANNAAFLAATPAEREASLVNAIEKAKGTRSILSPAESVNSITVGALHEEVNTNAPQNATDPYPSFVMTNLASSVGFGVNRSIKPDVVEQGGRFAVRGSNHPGGYVEVHPHVTSDFGQVAACPSKTGDLQATRRSAGTSNSTALITRTCNLIADALDEVFENDGLRWLDMGTRVPILKALLTHSCQWGDIGKVLEVAFPPQGRYVWSKRRDSVAKFLGYGRPQVEDVLAGNNRRITLLGDDVIKPEERHVYTIPIPKSMFRSREIKKIKITLAWTAPVLTSMADYRGVALRVVDEHGRADFWEGCERGGALQPNGDTTARGTVMHLQMEGKVAKQLKDNNQNLTICVQARALHDSLINAPIPYALAISIEVGQSITANIYQEVQENIRVPQRIRQRDRVGGA
ncbi:S8 family peptidase [Methylophilus medardicus]|uniref:S8 family peptidase n=1 Tax=Methylophilus medardicus TaxID=2588534 RepID=A0A5B8CTZ6_9PROT|nr:S8 family peptidase [Methylophilus medardicus]QDC44771.1 S8 family peptidase [Methylophilus medardicus]QDC49778.1 S8 family peptidase [Methylophilus medardicus]QDC53483.1 S8 family peptidase [Methylophilus medardicus]